MDDDLMRRLALDDERSFDSIFKLYYKDLLLAKELSSGELRLWRI